MKEGTQSILYRVSQNRFSVTLMTKMCPLYRAFVLYAPNQCYAVYANTFRFSIIVRLQIAHLLPPVGLMYKYPRQF